MSDSGVIAFHRAQTVSQTLSGLSAWIHCRRHRLRRDDADSVETRVYSANRTRWPLRSHRLAFSQLWSFVRGSERRLVVETGPIASCSNANGTRKSGPRTPLHFAIGTRFTVFPWQQWTNLRKHKVAASKYKVNGRELCERDEKTK